MLHLLFVLWWVTTTAVWVIFLESYVDLNQQFFKKNLIFIHSF